LHRIFGTDKESFTGTRDSFLQFVAEPDRAYVGQASLLAQRGGQFYEIEYRIRTTTGETRVVNEIGNVQRDENGKLVRVYGTTQDISERKKAEEEKELERMNKEALINVTDDLIWSVDRELKLIAANAAFIKKIKLETKITLRPGDELLMRDVYSEDHLLFWGDLYRRALAGEKFRKEVYSQGTIERAPDWQEIRFHPIHKNGEVMGIACYARDITERVNFLKELEKSNERFKYVSKATNDFTWDWDLITGDVTRPGNRLEVQFGYDPVGAPEVDEFWNTHAHPEDWAKVTRKRNAIFKNPFENYWEDDYRFLKPNGDYGYVNDRGYILRNEEGYPVRMIGASRDISRQKKAEEELKRLSLIAKETVNIVVILDPAGRIQWVNDAFTRITEFSFEEAAGKKPCEFLHGEKTAPETKKYIEDQLGEKRPFECEIIHYTKSGLPFWIKIQFQPMFNNKGILDHYFAIETDITDIKKSEEILKSSEKKYRYLFNNNPACIFIWDIDTLEVLEVNDTAVEQYGYTREEMLRNSMLEIRPKEEYDKLRAFAKSAKDDPFFKAIDTWKHIHKTGELMYMNIASHRILYKGKPAMLALANNVTERIMLEQELEEEKLQKQMEITKAVIAAQEQERAELGRELHDNINQILATTRFYMDYAITDEKKRIELIKQSKDFISTTINEIRNLSKSLLPPSLGEISLLEAFNDMVNNITKVHGLKISADWEHFDENLLHDDLKLAIFRILQEQLNNILKHAKASFVFISLKEGDNGIGLTVKDDGIGFDPTVKRNGLGLKNISSRAGLFNGVVELVSEPSKGVELRIQFPYFPHNERAIDIFRNKEKH
jgi:PAS domain S-box-containing protein